MLGAMIGDVVGSVYEWNNIKTKEFPLFSAGCTFTDDTVMTLAVASACNTYRQRRDIGTFQSVLVGEMRRLGSEYPGRGYGGMFSRWLTARDPQPYNSYGNGSAMRVSPVAYAAIDLAECELLARASAEVTHNHPEGIRGAQAVAAAVFLARQGKSKDEIKAYIEKRCYPLDFTLSGTRESYSFDATCPGSVPQAIAAFLESTGFEDALRNAVSIGGDSDTLACMAGAIASAYYGARNMPDESGIRREIRLQACRYLNVETCPDLRIYHRFMQEFCAPRGAQSSK